MQQRKHQNIGQFMALYGPYAGAAGAWLAYVGDYPLRLGVAAGLALTLLAGLVKRISAARAARPPRWANLV